MSGNITKRGLYIIKKPVMIIYGIAISLLVSNFRRVIQDKLRRQLAPDGGGLTSYQIHTKLILTCLNY